MPASGPPSDGSDDTSAVPVGPEPEPTGAGRGDGPGGWGEPAKVEPFAVAALVWAIVSIVLPIVGTIVALVLAARAADAIRRSDGTRSGGRLVTAARVVAGVVIAAWAIGLVAVLALGGDDDHDVAVPTQPSASTTLPITTLPTTTVRPPSTTVSTLPPTTTTVVPPTVITVAPPPTEPPTTPPTQPPTTPPTQPPTTPPTEPPTTPPTQPPTQPTNTTTAPTEPTTTPTTPTSTVPESTTTTTNPVREEEQRIHNALLRPNRLGPSNRGVPDDERAVVTYTPGQQVVITWAVNNGAPPLPTGEPTCGPVSTTTTTSLPPGETTSTTSSTTTSTTAPPGPDSTKQVARAEAIDILRVIKNEILQGRLDVTGVQLVGTYPIQGSAAAPVDVVQVFYYADELEQERIPTPGKVFQAPPAGQVQCLNPALA
jgi:hypothetical protein